MWGMMIAKAKYAAQLVQSKDHIEVGKMVKSVGSLLLCAAVFCMAKLINDNSILEKTNDFFTEKIDSVVETIEDYVDLENFSVDDVSFKFNL